MVAKNSSPSTDVVVKTDWSEIDSWEKAAALFQGGVADATDVFGDGVKLVDKEKLIDREFMLLEVREVWNKKTGMMDYLNFLCIARNGNKFCFNDGSTGCAKQATEYQEKHGNYPAGIYCEKGLRSSTYDVEIDGKWQEATTYYFA